MKVLFVYSNITCGCTKKYTFELAKGMMKYAETKVIYYTELTNDLVKQYDVVILQRLGTINIITDEEVNKIISIIEKNKASKRFIYIMDDLVLNSQNGLPIKFIKHCTDIFCTSQTLAKHIKEFNKNVHVFHTFIDVESLDKIPFTTYDKFTIVWASTGGLGSEIIKEIINNRDKMGLDFNLIMIGGLYGLYKEKEWIKSYPILKEDEMMALIRGAQLLLNPLTLSDKNKADLEYRCHTSLDEFLNGKSEIKYAIAGVGKICLLSSSTESFVKVIKNGENGMLLDNNANSWINTIDYLYKNRKEIDKMATNAYNNVKEEYNLDIGARQVFNLIQERKI